MPTKAMIRRSVVWTSSQWSRHKDAQEERQQCTEQRWRLHYYPTCSSWNNGLIKSRDRARAFYLPESLRSCSWFIPTTLAMTVVFVVCRWDALIKFGSPWIILLWPQWNSSSSTERVNRKNTLTFYVLPNNSRREIISACFSGLVFRKCFVIF